MPDYSKSMENSRELRNLLSRSEKKLDTTMEQVQTLIGERKKNINTIRALKSRISSDTRAAIDSLDYISSSLVKGDSRYCRKVSKLSKAICEEMNLSGESVQKAEILSRLHLTGLMFMKEESDEFRLYPDKSVDMIGKFSGLKKLALVFPHLDEFFDGSGPLSLKGRNVSVEIRVVKASAYYYFLFHLGKKIKEITDQLNAGSGSSLDPNVVSVIFKILVRKDFFADSDILSVGLSSLEPGMDLVSGVFSKRGAKLLPSGTKLDKGLIAKIASYNEGEAVVDNILIRR